MIVEPVNAHDTVLFDESFTNLLEMAREVPLDLEGSFLTLDSGFCSESNRSQIEYAGLIPVIKPNIRALKDAEKINALLDGFETYADIYKERYVIERCFAWEDTYRKLVIRYEKLQATFMGFRYLAYSMINLRSLIGKYGKT